MATGTVKWFSPEKGYGFVKPDNDGETDVFVHISAVQKAGLQELPDGTRINYSIINNKGKSSAGNIKLI